MVVIVEKVSDNACIVINKETPLRLLSSRRLLAGRKQVKRRNVVEGMVTWTSGRLYSH
jgi:hypothetical protein